MNKEILLICPKYPPIKDGLSGHTYELTKELSKNNNISILTDIKIPNIKDNDNLSLYPLVNNWKFYILKESFNSLNTKFDIVIVQYVPSLYGPRGGINFSILIFFLWLRFIKKQNTSFIFHEMYYPFLLNIKAMILHCIHRVMLFFSILSSKQSFYSTEKNLKIGKKMSLNNQHFHLPVGASISAQRQDIINDLEILCSSFVLFGGYHPSKRYEITINVFSELYKIEPNTKSSLKIIGTTKSELQKQMSLPSNFDEFALCLGVIDDIEVIKTLSSSTALIAYFSDGMSTRRSSAISALACNLPIITTKSDSTEKIFFNQSSINLLSVDEDTFAKDLIKLLSTMTFDKSHGAQLFYKENFSWEIIAKQLITRSLSNF